MPLTRKSLRRGFIHRDDDGITHRPGQLRFHRIAHPENLTGRMARLYWPSGHRQTTGSVHTLSGDQLEQRPEIRACHELVPSRLFRVVGAHPPVAPGPFAFGRRHLGELLGQRWEREIQFGGNAVRKRQPAPNERHDLADDVGQAEGEQQFGDVAVPVDRAQPISFDQRAQRADTGERVPIRDLVGRGGFRIWALDEATMRLRAAEVSNAFATGRKPVFRLVTRLGRAMRSFVATARVGLEWRRSLKPAASQTRSARFRESRWQ